MKQTTTLICFRDTGGLKVQPGKTTRGVLIADIRDISTWNGDNNLNNYGTSLENVGGTFHLAASQVSVFGVCRLCI